MRSQTIFCFRCNKLLAFLYGEVLQKILCPDCYHAEEQAKVFANAARHKKPTKK